jgi:murein DD-endopeptidase MepM/ murein hydrolase activator NlpD
VKWVRLGCAARLGCGLIGCAAPLIALFILGGAAGVLVGNWGALAEARVATAGTDGSSVVWPIDGGRVTQLFGPTHFRLEPARCQAGRCYDHFHEGLDISAEVGTPVVAIADGRIIFAGRLSDGAVIVVIDHGGGVESSYGHLRPDLAVSSGHSVVAGQLIGYVGMTGVTTGPHLHLEVHADGRPVDPLRVLPARP